MYAQVSPANDLENFQNHNRSRRLDVLHPADLRSEGGVRQGTRSVKVTLNGYLYRSTIAAMGGPPCVPLRKSNREAAGLEGGETIQVRIELDTEKREIDAPADFVKALKSAPPAWERWQALSYTHRREHVEAIEGAKAPETRARRIERATRMTQLTPSRESGSRQNRKR